jgi:D-alanine-D-alanine ligase
MSTLNSQVDSALVRNKFHTRLILERFKLPNIPYERLTTLEQAERFLQKHKTIIVKPTNGYGAQDINIVTDVRQIAVLNLKEYIFEKYVTGKEMRYLILNGKVIAVHQSEYGTSVAADRDLERLSFAQSEWDEELTNLALRVAQIFRLKFAAVDFLIDKGGKPYVLEVNTSPGLKWFHSPSSGPSVDVATMFLEAMLKD